MLCTLQRQRKTQLPSGNSAKSSSNMRSITHGMAKSDHPLHTQCHHRNSSKLASIWRRRCRWAWLRLSRVLSETTRWKSRQPWWKAFQKRCLTLRKYSSTLSTTCGISILEELIRLGNKCRLRRRKNSRLMLEKWAGIRASSIKSSAWDDSIWRKMCCHLKLSLINSFRRTAPSGFMTSKLRTRAP